MPLPQNLPSESAEAAAYLAELEAKVRTEGPIEKSAKGFGPVAQTLAGVLAGAGVGLGELHSGYADPNMSAEGKGMTVLLNALGGAAVGNPALRRGLFRKPVFKPTGAGGALPTYTRELRVSAPRVIAGGVAAASIPRYVNTTDAVARASRGAQEILSKDNVDAQIGEAVKKTVNSDAAKAFGGSLGRGLAGLAGGGIVGNLAGSALGSAVAPDDETLDYKARRGRERVRGLLTLLGTSAGGAGGTFLMHSLAKKGDDTTFDKQADLGALLKQLQEDPAVRQALTGAAVGAGVGGVGGLMLGEFGPRNKHPFTTAATGALLGAGIGGLAPTAYQQYQNMGPTQTREQSRAAFQKEWHPNRVFETLTGQAPDGESAYNQLVRGAGAGSEPNAVQRVTRDAGDFGYAGTPLDYAGGHPVSTVAGVGALGAHRANSWNQANAERLNDFYAGVKEMQARQGAEALADAAKRRLSAAHRYVEHADTGGWWGRWQANRALNRALGMRAGELPRSALNSGAGARVANLRANGKVPVGPRGNKALALAALLALAEGALFGN